MPTICNVCHGKTKTGDVYCRKCGAHLKSVGTKQLADRIMLIYGPPVHNKHLCPKCGYEWEVQLLGSDNDNYCPKCGAESEIIDL